MPRLLLIPLPLLIPIPVPSRHSRNTENKKGFCNIGCNFGSTYTLTASLEGGEKKAPLRHKLIQTLYSLLKIEYTLRRIFEKVPIVSRATEVVLSYFERAIGGKRTKQ